MSYNFSVKSPVLSSVRRHRARLDWSQAELADRVGVSRQAIVAIEADRQVPSTELALRLARALGTSVEELFRLEEPETIVLSDWKEQARAGRVHLGRVDERWAAFAADASEECCDGIASWGADEVLVRPLVPLEELTKNVLVAGCAPLLGMVGRGFARNAAQGRATWISSTSTRALELLVAGRVHIAGIHLVDTDAPEGHAPIIREKFFDQAMTVVNLTRFRQGLFVRQGNPKGITTVSDFLRDDVRPALRLPGAGAQLVTERKLREAFPCTSLPDAPIARSHGELSSWVREGLVDVGVGIEPAALREGLDFVPLVEERFDLIVPENRLSERSVARYLDQIETAAFRTEVAHVPGYDMGIAAHATTIQS